MHSSSTRVQEHIGDPVSAEPVLPREKLEEMITHIAHYGGWPVAVGGFRSLDAVWPVDE